MTRPESAGDQPATEYREPDARERFDACFRANYASILAFALRRLRDRSRAEDAAAETFAVAWRRFDVVPDEPLPWLYATARLVIANEARSQRRASRLRGRLEDERPRSPDRDPADAIAGSEAVLIALAKLTERDREALRLTAWEGLDGRRAAAVLGCSRGAFQVRLHRARRKLAKELARAGHVPATGSTTSRTSLAPEETG